jgi:hypothetical protein
MARPKNLNGGRPPRVTGEETVNVTARLTTPELDALDASRGDAPRSTAIRDALAVTVPGWPASEPKKETTP